MCIDKTFNTMFLKEQFIHIQSHEVKAYILMQIFENSRESAIGFEYQIRYSIVTKKIVI